MKIWRRQQKRWTFWTKWIISLNGIIFLGMVLARYTQIGSCHDRCQVWIYNTCERKSTAHCFFPLCPSSTCTGKQNHSGLLEICFEVSVNFIRARALNHRLFKVFCEQGGSEHTVLLYHTELSRCLVLSRVFELRTEMEIFLRERKFPLSEHFCENKFIGALAYFTDILSHLNQLNVQMQGRNY